MKLLALDTATEACSAALLVDGEILSRYTVQPRQHGRLILGMCEALLAEGGLATTGLDAIAFGRGPGAFTGVRIAIGAVQGLAAGADLPVIPVSNLAALAHRAWREYESESVLAAIDARMGEVYWSGYRVAGEGRAEPVIGESVSDPDAVTVPDGRHAWHGAGTGWRAHGGRLGDALGGVRLDRIHEDLLPAATDIAWLACHSDTRLTPEEAVPVYLRDRVAARPGERL